MPTKKITKFTSDELLVLFKNKKVIADLNGDIYLCNRIFTFEISDKSASGYPILNCKQSKHEEFADRRVFFSDLTKTEFKCNMMSNGWKNNVVNIRTIGINRICNKKMFEPIDFFIQRLKNCGDMSNSELINKIVNTRHKRRVEKGI